MSLLTSFLRVGKPSKKNPKAHTKEKPRQKFPSRMRSMRSPSGKIFERAIANGATKEDLARINLLKTIEDIEVGSKDTRLVKEWLNQLAAEAPQLMSLISSHKEWNVNLIDALVECAIHINNPNKEFSENAKKRFDPRVGDLYGALTTLVEAYDEGRTKFLDDEFDKNNKKIHKSIQWIYKEHERIDKENIWAEKAKSHALVFAKFIFKEDFSLEEEYCAGITKIFKDSPVRKWQSEIYGLLVPNYLSKEKLDATIEDLIKSILPNNHPSRKFIEDKNTIVINDSFLKELNPEKKIEKISREDFKVLIAEHLDLYSEYSIFELFTRSQLKEDTNVLNNCLGNSSYYSDRIEGGIIRIFSVRIKYGGDYEQEFDIEYDIKSRKILQFRGQRDVLVDDEMLNAAIGNLRASGIEVLGLKLSIGIAVFQKDGQWSLLEKKREESFLSYENHHRFMEEVTQKLQNGYSMDTDTTIYLGVENIFSDMIDYTKTILQNKSVNVGFEDFDVIPRSLWQIKQVECSFNIESYFSNSVYPQYSPKYKAYSWSSKENPFLNGLEKVGGNINLVFNKRFEPEEYGDGQFPVFKNLEIIEGRIRVSFPDPSDVQFIKSYIEFNFPKLVQKYGGYEGLMQSDKLALSIA